MAWRGGWVVGMWPGHMWDASGDVRLAPGVSFSMLEGGLFFQLCSSLLFTKMNSRVQDAAQTGHKRQATKTGRHVVTQGSLGDGGVLRRRGEPELGRNLFRRRELQRD